MGLLREILNGERGIWTPGTVARTPDFESGTIGHSVISPFLKLCNILYGAAAGQHIFPIFFEGTLSTIRSFAGFAVLVLREILAPQGRKLKRNSRNKVLDLRKIPEPQSRYLWLRESGRVLGLRKISETPKEIAGKPPPKRFGITGNTGKPKGKYLCKSSTAVPKERFSRGKGNWKIIFGDKNRRFFRK